VENDAKQILTNYGVDVCPGFIWLRTGSRGMKTAMNISDSIRRGISSVVI